MGRRKRVDRNQAEIVAALRELGFSVYPLHFVGQGFPDLIVGRGGSNWLIEVKAGKEPLTEDEREFHAGWRGHVIIVRSVEEALDFAQQVVP